MKADLGWIATGMMVVLMGCAGSADKTADGSDPAPPPPARFSKTAPTTDTAHPTQIVMRNGGDQPIFVDVTFGPGSPVTVTTLLGEFGMLFADDPQAHCPCPCNPKEVCPECEAPQDKQVEIKPGEAYEWEWNGRLLQYRMDLDGDYCFAAFEPAPGRHLLRVCDTDAKACGVADVTLPTEQPVEVILTTEQVVAPNCPLPDETVQRLANLSLARMESSQVVVDRIQECDPQKARCVPVEEVATWQERMRRYPCTVFVVPRGDELESQVFLPLPEGYVGGEEYSLYFDPQGVGVRRVRYTQ